MTQEERNWKLYEASKAETDRMRRTMNECNDFSDKWLMTLAAGSFGLSFAFIEKVVPLADAVSKPLLIAAWSCFAIVLALEIIASDVADFRHFFAIVKENKDVLLRYEGKEPEQKKQNPFIDINRVIGYFVVFAFIGGLVCLMLFVARNLLK